MLAYPDFLNLKWKSSKQITTQYTTFLDIERLKLLLFCHNLPLSSLPYLSHLMSYSVFETLRSEARVMEGLRSLQIESLFIHDILKLNVQPSDSDYAVDIRNPAINVRALVNTSYQ